MSANNATYILHVEWTYLIARLGDIATASRTEPYYFVFEGDVDFWGELTRKGKLTKAAMWYLLMNETARKFTSREAADTYAGILEQQSNTEYGVMEVAVTYKTK